MTRRTGEPPNHNTLTCYTDYKCRLPECVARYNDRNMARIRAQKDGTWNGLVDADPIRQHLLALAVENIGPGAVAYTTGLPIQTIIDFTRPRRDKRRGKRHRTTPEIAAKILAVTVDNHTRGRRPAAGTHRRIQALAAAGWPLIHIAAHAKLSRPTPSDLLRRETVFAGTANAIATAYDYLRNKKPERHGVDKVQADRTRNWAKRQNWAPVSYWNDRLDVIDDPHFESMYGITRRELIAQDANWVMRTTGIDRQAAAERLGVSKSYVEHAFRDHPEYAVDVAA
ncbi:hypothetical protein ACF061_01055 [Streptomyces sp. NPDC015220]|uniref:hypothetical protein n=1 Tax=Streptomyces sp. NPDC015220 TaxID=3364947 RepID=UPI0036FE9A09